MSGPPLGNAHVSFNTIGKTGTHVCAIAYMVENVAGLRRRAIGSQ